VIQIKHEPPPNYKAITAAFSFGDVTPIFAYAPYIYDPFMAGVPAELIAHEQVHITRQGALPELWWESYIADENFRLAEELLAHVAEYYVLTNGRGRPERRRVFAYLERRLRAPIYGYKPPLSRERSKILLKMALREGEKSTASGLEVEPINMNAM